MARPLPAQPLNVQATDGTSVSTVTVTWSSAARADSYKIYRSTTPGVSGNLLGGSFSLSYLDTTALAGTIYWYSVKGVNDSGSGPISAQASGYVVSIPAQPTGLSATDATGTTVTVSWLAAALATSYKVYRSTVSGQTGSLIATVVGSVSFIDTTAAIGQLYYYRVSGVNSFGEGPPSAQDVGSVANPAALPAQPKNLIASDGTDTFVHVSWDWATRTDSFEVYRSTVLGQSGSLLASVPITTLSINDVTAMVGQTYWYSVRGVNAYGVGNFSAQNAGSAVGVAPPPPSSHVLTTASTNPTGVTITTYHPSDVDRGRVWVTAPLRSGTNTMFTKWQKDGVDYDTASTTSLLLDADYTMTAVYTTPASSGIAVAPGTDTLAAAMVGQPAGTTYLLQAGVHRFTAAVAPRSGDTIQGANGAYIRGCAVITPVTSGSNWVATGQTQDFYASFNNGDPNACLPGSPLCYRRERVYYDGTELLPVASLAALTPGHFFFDYPNDSIYIKDNPSGHVVEATNGSGGFVGFGTSNINITLRNLVLERFGSGYVAGEGHDVIKAMNGWVVENCEIRYCGYAGIDAFGSAIVRNNYVHHCGQYGLVGSPAKWEGNVVESNNTDGFDPNNDAGGSKFLHSINMQVRGNTFLNNTGNGIWSDFDNKDALYENNILRGNTQAGIDSEVNCGGIVRYNVFDSNNAANATKSLYWAGQIYSSNSRDLEVYENDITIGTGTHGVSIRGDVVSETTPQCGTFANSNMNVHDNTIRLANGSLHGYVGSPANSGTTNFVGNDYIVPSLSGLYFQFASASMTFAQWQALGQDVTGTVAIP